MRSKTAFTLVEMLIVVVIIGILASALIPRLTGAQSRARDAARSADLNQAVTAMSVYFSDNGVYPSTGGALSGVREAIVPRYMDSLPSDPQAGRRVKMLYSKATSNPVNVGGGQYAYAPLTKNAAMHAGMVLGANVESQGDAANWVIDDNSTLSNLNPSIQNSNNGRFVFVDEGGDSSNATEVANVSPHTCDNGVEINNSGNDDLANCVADNNPSMSLIQLQ